MTTGPDVSSYQGSVDWGAVRRAGHSFAVCKATEGTTYVDPTFSEARRQALHAAGFPLVGFYHFAHPGRNPVEAEVRHFLDAVGAHRPGEVAALDLEAPGEINHAAGQWAARWCDLVEAAGWPPVLIYGNGSDLSAMDTSQLVRRPLWVAGYPRATTLDRWSAYTLHQFTDRASVPGINGGCDLSESPLDEAALARLGGAVGPQPQPQPQPQSPEEDDMGFSTHVITPGTDAAICLPGIGGLTGFSQVAASWDADGAEGEIHVAQRDANGNPVNVAELAKGTIKGRGWHFMVQGDSVLWVNNLPTSTKTIGVLIEGVK